MPFVKTAGMKGRQEKVRIKPEQEQSQAMDCRMVSQKFLVTPPTHSSSSCISSSSVHLIGL